MGQAVSIPATLVSRSHYTAFALMTAWRGLCGFVSVIVVRGLLLKPPFQRNYSDREKTRLAQATNAENTARHRLRSLTVAIKLRPYMLICPPNSTTRLGGKL
ncbi:hypothetical protein SBC1_45480 (plasmid) [Caballeronia sp. SBC1]|nr:hypothetical protein SBC2_42490 [Caballeronia sp. SBC2]QIN64508.1 hypothetical protein SBC1_45480 [Caballeronia sp. SBC1]